jgi:hypothetical protein
MECTPIEARFKTTRSGSPYFGLANESSGFLSGPGVDAAFRLWVYSDGSTLFSCVGKVAEIIELAFSRGVRSTAGAVFFCHSDQSGRMMARNSLHCGRFIASPYSGNCACRIGLLLKKINGGLEADAGLDRPVVDIGHLA